MLLCVLAHLRAGKPVLWRNNNANITRVSRSLCVATLIFRSVQKGRRETFCPFGYELSAAASRRTVSPRTATGQRGRDLPQGRLRSLGHRGQGREGSGERGAVIAAERR